MRKILISFLSMLLSLSLFAQANDETVYKDWQANAESKNEIQVSYRLVKCQGVNQVHLKLVSSSAANQLMEFTVTVSNSETESIIKNVSYTVSNGSEIAASCSAISLGALKVDMPGGYDPSKVSVKITFK
jgi:hypothetical protein